MPRPVESVHRKRPFGVSAPPVGKLPSLVSLPTGLSCRPVGWIRVLGPTMLLPPPVADQAMPAAPRTTIPSAAPRTSLPGIRGILPLT